MPRPSQASLLPALIVWLQKNRAVQAAVLFGSQVRKPGEPAAFDGWSDVDLHIITNHAQEIEKTNWAKVLPNHHLCMQVSRPATGGVKKLTILFSEGEADVVILPASRLRLAKYLMSLRMHKRITPLRTTLNSLATILGGGYQFLKGENRWASFYAKVVSEMPGYRISNTEAKILADTFLCDLLWVLQKLERGELVAAQRIMHNSLLEKSILLLHEARTRQGRATFQQARRVEQLVSSNELRTIQVSAHLEKQELRSAAWTALNGLNHLMDELETNWAIPLEMSNLLKSYAVTVK